MISEHEINVLDNREDITNPYDLYDEKGGSAAYEFADDRTFLNDLVITVLYHEKNGPKSRFARIAETAKGCIVHLRQKHAYFFEEIESEDDDDQNYRFVRDLEPEEVASQYVANLFGELPAYWDKISKELYLIIAALAFCRTLGEEHNNFGIEEITDYVTNEKLDPALVSLYTNIIRETALYRLGNNPTLQQYAASLPVELYPEVRSITGLIERLSLAISLKGKYYRRPRVSSDTELQYAFGMRRTEIQRLINREKRKKHLSVLSVIQKAEQRAGIFVPELVLASLDSIILHFGKVIREIGEESIPDFNSEDFERIFGMPCHRIEYVVKKHGLSLMDIIHRGIESAHHRKMLYFRDYRES